MLRLSVTCLRALLDRFSLGRCTKAALDADTKKCSKHSDACTLSGYGFKAFATDICGVISSSSHRLLGHIASSYAPTSNRTYSYALNIWKRHISFAIQEGLARQLTTSPAFSSSLMEDLLEAL
jgi:hypothetical protein